MPTLIPLWRVMKVSYGRTNNKSEPVEMTETVALFDSLSGANAYADELRASMDTEKVKAIMVRTFNVDSLDTMHADLKKLPFNVPLQAKASSANETANSNGQESKPRKGAKSAKVVKR